MRLEMVTWQKVMKLCGAIISYGPASVQKWWTIWCIDIVSYQQWSSAVADQCSFQTVPVSVTASTIQWLHSHHKIMWLSTSTKQKNKRGVQWQLNRSYCLTCTPGCIAAQFNRHGNCTTTIVDTLILSTFQATCCSRYFKASDIECSCSMVNHSQLNRLLDSSSLLIPTNL